jgi:hypothetical protein
MLHILQRHANTIHHSHKQNNAQGKNEGREQKRSADFDDCRKHKKKGLGCYALVYFIETKTVR